MTRRLLSLLMPGLALGLIVGTLDAVAAEAIQLDTEVTYVGERYWLTAWYFAEVRPGWVAVVTAICQTNKGDDDLARDLFESLAFSDEPECFSQEIAGLKN